MSAQGLDSVAHANDLFAITVSAEGQSFDFKCREDEPLLTAMERAGLALVPVGCRGGGCGVCAISVEEGDFSCGKMSRGHITEEQEKSGNKLLSCKTFPSSNMQIQPDGMLFKKLRKTAKALSEQRSINPMNIQKGGL